MLFQNFSWQSQMVLHPNQLFLVYPHGKPLINTNLKKIVISFILNLMKILLDEHFEIDKIVEATHFKHFTLYMLVLLLPETQRIELGFSRTFSIYFFVF